MENDALPTEEIVEKQDSVPQDTSALESRIVELEDKITMLLDTIKEIDTGERRNEFHAKWADKIGEIEPDQKTVYGDSWNEEDGLWDYHEKNKDTEGYDEDTVFSQYFEEVKDRFKKLRGEADTPEQEAIVDEAEEEAKEADSSEEAEQIVTEAEEEIAQGPDEEEVRAALANRDF